MSKKYALYLLRWQLSTPILALVIWLLGATLPTILVTIIANLIGGAIFFWIDRVIFRTTSKLPLWEIEDNKTCVDCGQYGTGYRIVEWRGYNRRVISNAKYRCIQCKDVKRNQLAVNLNERVTI